MFVVIGRPLLTSSIALLDVGGDAAEVAAVDVGVDVELALHRVVVDRFQAGARIDRRDVGQPHDRRGRAARIRPTATLVSACVTGVASRSATELIWSIGVCTATE